MINLGFFLRFFCKSGPCSVGDYHVAVSKHNDGHVTFNGDEFVASRPAKFRPMLTTLMSSQAFHQFIDERIDVFNTSGAPPKDMFEDAIGQCREAGGSARTLNKVCTKVCLHRP